MKKRRKDKLLLPPTIVPVAPLSKPTGKLLYMDYTFPTIAAVTPLEKVLHEIEHEIGLPTTEPMSISLNLPDHFSDLSSFHSIDIVKEMEEALGKELKKALFHSELVEPPKSED